MEANDFNIAAYWESIQVPVLAIYGEYDWIMSKDDHPMIVESINDRNKGMATYFEAPKTTDGLLLANSLQSAFDDYSPDYDPVISEITIRWLQSNFLK